MMAFRSLFSVLLVAAIVSDFRCEDDLRDLDFMGSDSDEVMIAQESRHYNSFVKPPVKIVKPTGVTNSHRPQYNLDSLEESLVDIEDYLESSTKRTKAYKPSYKLRSKELMIKDAVLRALERKDHVGKFAQILPIIRAMSGNQRVALASLVASQVTTPPGRAPLNLAQVRSMFGNNSNTTTDLMLPILLDMANLIKRAVSSGKQAREVRQPPQAQMLRRSFNEDETQFDDDIDTEFDRNIDESSDKKTHEYDDNTFTDNHREHVDNKAAEQHDNKSTERRDIKITKHDDIKTTSVKPKTLAQRLRSSRISQRTNQSNQQLVNQPLQDHNRTVINDANSLENPIITHTQNEGNNTSKSTIITESTVIRGRSAFKSGSDNSSIDLAVNATNQTLDQDLPVAEKLRALNRYVDRKGNLIRRGYPLKPVTRRTTVEPTLSPVTRRRPAPPKKLPTTATEQTKCELFTNTLCLHSEDYPTDAIVQSIRRNKAAAGALLADFRDPGQGAVDGVTADQEAKYTAEHYLISNRRGDTANRDFASAGEAGFMCPSTVKYARPQRARATSGQWKYIVNTGEHTQTLRLEKCLKPKEPCTYLTDNFKSKCVQVYNYHRLLTWDQQSGLHMDIFKVPTCCSCHIEGYSVSFPPLGHRIHESSPEQSPSDDVTSVHRNQAFESVQSTNHRPSVSKVPLFTHTKPLEAFPPLNDNQNLISGISFTKNQPYENDEVSNGHVSHSNPKDSYGNSYFPDSFDQLSSKRNVKRPLSSRLPIILAVTNNFDSVTLPSFLEPPTPAGPDSFTFIKETPNKFKITGSQFKRGPVVRPNRHPIRKKISTGPEDLISSGTSAIESYGDSDLETMEDFSDDLEDLDIVSQAPVTNTAKRVTIAPKLQAVTTEASQSTTFRPQEQSNSVNENFAFNGKKINYNYHPIIDFFGNLEKEQDNESIDREDSEPYISAVQSEWKPINNLLSRNLQNSNLSGRKTN